MELTLHKDVRNPKRKIAWSGANMEVLFVMKQRKSRKQRGLVARDMFTNCGESTNFSRSYTGVPYRNLVEIPRLTADAKQKITGVSAVGDFQKMRVTKEVIEKGHPLLWSEWKPVTLYSTLFRDFQVAGCSRPVARFWSSVLSRVVVLYFLHWSVQRPGASEMAPRSLATNVHCHAHDQKSERRA